MTANIIDPIRSKAEGFVDMGNLDQAEILYRKILSHNDKDTDANYMLGVILAEKADFIPAIEFLNKAIEINSQYPDSYFILAKIQQVKREYQHAFDNCLIATSLDAEFDEAWLLLCSLSRALNENPQAIISCEQALKFYPDSIVAHSNLADVLFNEHKFEEASEYYNKAILLEQTNVSILKKLCLSLLKCKKFKNALDAANAGLRVEPNEIDFLNFITEAKIELKELDNAESAANTALLTSPNDVNALINMGNVIQKRHQYKEAITWYKKALEIDTDNASIYHNLGVSYFKLDEKDQSANEFRKALELNPNLSVSKHMLAVALGENEARADNDYVTDLFDEYAHRYDEHQKDLKYRVPEHVNNAVQQLYSENKLIEKVSVLDLGCGTGLCAPHLKDISSSLIGVDLSPDMVDIADKLGLYSELVVGDMSECMNDRPNAFGLAVAGDVFVYIGDLDQEFKAARIALKEGAFFVFTVQVNDAADEYELTDTGRYNHADNYIKTLIDSYGFIQEFSKDIISRVDYGVPVNSRIYVLQNKKEYLN